MGGGGGQSTSTVSIPPQVLARYCNVNNIAQQTAQAPFQYYSGEFVAPLTDTQQYGIANTNAAANMAQPYYQAATNNLMGAQAQAQPYVNAATMGTVGAAQQGQQYLGAATQGTLGAAQQGQQYLGAATQGTMGAAQQGQQYLGAATGLAGASAYDVNAQPLNVSQYMSPYLQNVAASQMGLLNQQFQQAQSGQLGQAIQSGAFGGDRSGIAAANLQQQQSLAANQELANILNTGYSTALGAAQQQQGVNLASEQANRANLQAVASQLGALGQQGYAQQLGAAGQLGALGQQGYAQQLGAAGQLGTLGQQGYAQGLGAANQLAGLGQQEYAMGANTANQLATLGAGSQGAALQGAQAQLAAGQIEQANRQARDTALYNQFLQAQSYPFQTAQFLANIAEGTGSLSGSTTSTQTTQNGIFSDERLKEDVRPVGKTYDGQKIYSYRYKGDPKTHIGLMAQEVEAKHPEAVGLAGGYKTVDYDKATDKAAERGHFAGGGLAGYTGGFDPSLASAILANYENIYAPLLGGSGAAGIGGGLGAASGRVPVGGIGNYSLHAAPVASIPQAQNPITQGADISKSLKEIKQNAKNLNLSFGKRNQQPTDLLAGTGYGQQRVTDAKPSTMPDAPDSSTVAQDVPDLSSSASDSNAEISSILYGDDSLPAQGADISDFGNAYRGGRIYRASGGNVDVYQDTESGPSLDIPDTQGHYTLNSAPAAGSGAGGGGDTVGGLLGGAGSFMKGIADIVPFFLKTGGRVGYAEGGQPNKQMSASAAILQALKLASNPFYESQTQQQYEMPNDDQSSQTEQDSPDISEDVARGIAAGVGAESGNNPYAMQPVVTSSNMSLVAAPKPAEQVALGKVAKPGRLDPEIVDYLTAHGISESIARGIAAGISAESGNNPYAINPASGAFGLGQWLGPRLARSISQYGLRPSKIQQLDFLLQELQGGDPGGKYVLAAKDSLSALNAYVKNFMRPKAGAETEGDIKRGLAAYHVGYASGGLVGRNGYAVRGFVNPTLGGGGSDGDDSYNGYNTNFVNPALGDGGSDGDDSDSDSGYISNIMNRANTGSGNQDTNNYVPKGLGPASGKRNQQRGLLAGAGHGQQHVTDAKPLTMPSVPDLSTVAQNVPDLSTVAQKIPSAPRQKKDYANPIGEFFHDLLHSNPDDSNATAEQRQAQRDAHTNAVMSVLSGLAGFATAPTKNLGYALASGLGAGIGSYQQQREYENLSLPQVRANVMRSAAILAAERNKAIQFADILFVQQNPALQGQAAGSFSDAQGNPISLAEWNKRRSANRIAAGNAFDSSLQGMSQGIGGSSNFAIPQSAMSPTMPSATPPPAETPAGAPPPVARAKNTTPAAVRAPARRAVAATSATVPAYNPKLGFQQNVDAGTFKMVPFSPAPITGANLDAQNDPAQLVRDATVLRGRGMPGDLTAADAKMARANDIIHGKVIPLDANSQPFTGYKLNADKQAEYDTQLQSNIAYRTQRLAEANKGILTSWPAEKQRLETMAEQSRNVPLNRQSGKVADLIGDVRTIFPDLGNYFDQYQAAHDITQKNAISTAFEQAAESHLGSKAPATTLREALLTSGNASASPETRQKIITQLYAAGQRKFDLDRLLVKNQSKIDDVRGFENAWAAQPGASLEAYTARANRKLGPFAGTGQPATVTTSPKENAIIPSSSSPTGYVQMRRAPSGELRPYPVSVPRN